jgi:hypothetical protein
MVPRSGPLYAAVVPSIKRRFIFEGFVGGFVRVLQACSIRRHAWEQALLRHKYGLAPLYVVSSLQQPYLYTQHLVNFYISTTLISSNPIDP